MTQTDEWTEQRRYMGLELLSKARLTLIDSDTPTDTTEPRPSRDRRVTSTRIFPMIVSYTITAGRGPDLC
jgi:hypothetical protein